MTQFHDVFFEYLQSRFGHSISKLLFTQYQQKLGITNLQQLSQQDQLDFVNKTIYGVYAKFYPPDKIQRIILACLFRFGMLEAASRTQSMTNMANQFSEVAIEKIHDISQVKSLQDNAFCLGFNFDGDMKAALHIFIDNEQADQLGRKVVQSMMGDQQGMDTEFIQSAIVEYFNVILPALIDVVTNTLNISVTFLPIDQATMQQQLEGTYMSLATSSITIIQKHAQITLRSALLMEQVSDTLMHMLEKDTNVTDVLNSSKIVIVAEQKDDKYEALVQFLKKYANFVETDIRVQDAMKDCNIIDMHKVSVADLDRIIEFLTKRYFYKYSDFKKRNIAANIQYIYGYYKKEDDVQ
ncbi:MAG: hypothetical protein ACMXYC_03375 [Candidatus Woesearchaeota archaeon]